MKATWLDRSIDWISPGWGFRRARARAITAALGYEGGRRTRHTENWITASSSADTEIHKVLNTLRDSARDLVRNNPYATRGLEIKVASTIGTGIMGEVDNSRALDAWEAFVKTCDIEAAMDFYGMLALHERCRSESGESLIRFVNVKQKPGLPVTFQLQLLEPDYIDSSRDGRNSDNGNRIRRGIEFEKTGEPAAYWLFPEHPGDSYSTYTSRTGSYNSVRVPARDVIHTFRKLRPGQTRGVTEFAPVITRVQLLDDYDESVAVRKRVEACIAAWITSPEGADAKLLGPKSGVSTDTTGRKETLHPGMIVYGTGAESASFLDPRPSGDFADFERFGLRAISAGYGVPYELMTSDLSEVNYSSARVGLVHFRRRCETDQWLLHIPQVCQRIWDRFLPEASAIRPSISSKVQPRWTPPRFELVDPQKETEADLASCLAGFEPYEDIVRRRGWTSSEVLAAIKKWQDYLKEQGIVLTSDARTKQAAAQASAS